MDITSDAIDDGAEPARSAAIPRVLRTRSFRRAQQVHAATVLAMGTSGILIAITLAALGHPPTAIDLALFLSFVVPTGLGTTVGLHRHFTHRSFQAKESVRVVLAILGSSAMQGSLFFWVALHRRHHENTDGKGDPHSPHIREDGSAHKTRWHGLWHSYMGWTFRHEVPNAAYYARDMIRHPALSRVNSLYLLWVALGLLFPAALGGWLHGSWLGVLTGLVWGGFIRIFVWHNIVWYISSLAHMLGRNDYESGDMSKNSVWMALPTLGESFHNNHHAFPTAPLLRMKWYQFDLSGMFIQFLEALGLAWDLKRPSAQLIQSKTVASGRGQ